MKSKLQKYILALITLMIFNCAKIHAQYPEFYGMTSGGGEFSAGTIFKTDCEGNNLSVVYSMFKFAGKFALGSLIQADNGKLYGMTCKGGLNNMGVLFEWAPATNTYSLKFNFDGRENGSYPYGSLMQADNGKLYGMTFEGGENNEGLLFEWDPDDDIFTKKLDFNRTENGAKPYGSLMQADNGKLYGMTSQGGANNMGILFEWAPVSDTISLKFNFDGKENGSWPYGSLMQADNGKLYGMTSEGGANNMGILFEWAPSTNIFTKKLDFNGTENGCYPWWGCLIQAGNGKLYGMTYRGGLNDMGVLFEWDTATNTYIKKLDFNGTENGCNPLGSLMLAGNGKLYGLTNIGGVYDEGVLFEWDPATDTYTKKIDFSFANYECTSPVGSLIQAGDGKLYGMTMDSGPFEWDTAINIITNIFHFNSAENGSHPISSLMQAGNGKLYGMTPEGGENNVGVLFEFEPATGTYIKKFDFDGAENGSYPEGSLMQADNGKIFGMTSGGGTNSVGVLFEWDPLSDTYTKKFDFDLEGNGSTPWGSLMQADNGKLYGMTRDGVSSGYGGVLFEWNPVTDTYTKKSDLEASPHGVLMQADNGKLYGMTSQGGGGVGTIFEWDLVTDTYTKKLIFKGVGNGHNPFGSLIQADNGKFYGMTFFGGVNSYGILFEWNTDTDTIIKKLDFNGAENGKYPYSSLIQASNGKLYGMTYQGGLNDMGVLFEWDPATGTYTKKADFNGTENGSAPHGSLTEICQFTPIYVEVCESYTSPSGKYVWTSSGIYKDTIPDAEGNDSIISVNLTIGVDISVTQDQSVLRANATGATYQWIDCDKDNVPIYGETNKTFTAVTNGNYAVIISKNQCTDTSACFTVIVTGLILNTFKHHITLYPNPNNGSFSIDMGKFYSDVTVTITGMDGRIIQRENINQKKVMVMHINTSPGTYLVTITNESERAIFKMIKK